MIIIIIIIIIITDLYSAFRSKDTEVLLRNDSLTQAKKRGKISEK